MEHRNEKGLWRPFRSSPLFFQREKIKPREAAWPPQSCPARRRKAGPEHREVSPRRDSEPGLWGHSPGSESWPCPHCVSLNKFLRLSESRLPYWSNEASKLRRVTICSQKIKPTPRKIEVTEVGLMDEGSRKVQTSGYGINRS